MINSFRQYLVEEEKIVYFTFGRMNPPTIGHGKLLDKVKQQAGSQPYRVYVSQSQDSKKNPLSYQDKIKHVRKMFPKHARSVMSDKKVKTAIDAAVQLYNQGFRKLVMVVGSDRIREFDILLNKYNGKKARHGFYDFMDIKVVSAGDRDPDAEGVEGMSASKQRENASKNDFIAFSQGLPTSMNNNAARKLFNDVRSGMGLKEQKFFKNHIQLNTVSSTREAYVNGDLFHIDQLVTIKGSEELGVVKVLGSNYLVVEMNDQKRFRKWLTDVKPLELDEEYEAEWGTDKATSLWKKATPGQEEATTLQDKDIAGRKGTQPARYHTGLSKSTKAARDAQFKRQAKMSDKDPSAYRPAPGDKTAKTKPSKYTRSFKSMFGEEVKGKQLVHHGDTTKNFDICPSALKAFDENQKDGMGDKDGFHEAVVAVDKYLGFEKQLVRKGSATEADLKKMKTLVDNAKQIISKAELKGHDYHQIHIDTVERLVKKETNEQVDDNKRLQDRQKKEMERIKARHDRQDDRMRLKMVRQKNRETK